MKNLIKNIYVFSKLSIVFVLIIILFFIIYLFYISYIDQTKVKKIESEQDSNIIKLINKNSKNIQELSLIIESLNKNIADLDLNSKTEKTINERSANEKQVVLKEIKKEISLMKSEIQNIKIKNFDLPDSSKNIESEILKEILYLIKLKFESGESFSNELEILSKFKSIVSTPALEKINLLSESNFSGNNNLLIIFRKEMNDFISSIIITEKNIFRPLLPFIEIKPSPSQNISNDILKSLNKIDALILKKKYQESYKRIKKINNYENYFKETIKQLNIGADFNNALNLMINVKKTNDD